MVMPLAQTGFTLERDHDGRLRCRVVGPPVQGIAPTRERHPGPLRSPERDPISLPDHRARPRRRPRTVVRATRRGDVRGERAVFLDLEDNIAIVRIEGASELSERAGPGSAQLACRREALGPGRVDTRSGTSGEGTE